MYQSNLFPQGYAMGDAFCNREQERAKLKASILANEHTVIVAPRRYGKTSLITQVFFEMNIPAVRIDLLPATNSAFVQRALKTCFSELLDKAVPQSQSHGAKQKLIDFIQEFNPKLTISLLGQKLEVTATKSPESGISDILLGVNAVAKKMNIRMAICLDEFQQVGMLKDNHALEASIRHAVEASTHVAYIFSGSNRHLLQQMFSSKSRPLYHLCDLMELQRIKQDIYSAILMEREQKQWGVGVEAEQQAVVTEILTLTRRHPFYVNALCRHLWKLPQITVPIVQKSWFEYVDTNCSWIADDLASMTPNQRNILAALAYQPIAEPYSIAFSSKVQMVAASIKKSLDVLVKKDFVYRDTSDACYKVTDPAIEMYLRGVRYFDFVE
jgi:uncharacterized protein